MAKEWALKRVSKYLNRRYAYGYAWTWRTNLDASGTEDFNEPYLLKKGDDLIDGGAAWGFWSVRASPFFNRIVAFEPVDSCYKELCVNIRINHLINVTPVKMALSATEGSQLFNDYGGLLSAQPELMGTKAKYASKPVELTRIDKIVQNKGLKPSMIKLDVEGAEISVLEGARETIRQFKPTLLVEVHLPITVDDVKKEVEGYRWEERLRYLNTDLYPSVKQPHLLGKPE